MADIKQAAKWLDESKQIRLPEMGPSYLFRKGNRILIGESLQRSIRVEDYEISMMDLLSDDWEIA